MAIRPENTPTLTDALDLYMRARYKLSEATKDNDRSVLGRLIRGIGSNKKVGNVTQIEVETWFAEVVTLTNKESSFNKCRQRAMLFFRYCGKRGWTGIDLMGGVEAMDVPEKERLRLTPEPMVEMLEIPQDPRDRGFIGFAINTGLRASEIARITVGCVDMQTGRVKIRRSKKNKRIDYMPMSPRLRAEVVRWMTAYSQELGNRPLRKEYLLFPNRFAPRLKGGNDPGRGRQMQLGALRPDSAIREPWNIIQRVLPELGINISFQEGVHTIRRSAARAFFDFQCAHGDEPGFDSALRVTASFLGHKSTATTEIYLGLDADRDKRDRILFSFDFLPPDPEGGVGGLRIVS